MSEPENGKFVYERDGYCPICDNHVLFQSKSFWYRDDLHCSSCNSIVRERAIAVILSQVVPNWRESAIHECSPVSRGMSLKLKSECSNYIASNYFPQHPLGAKVQFLQNENLESQTFSTEAFDVVVSLDVMEHVFRPDLAYAEVYRTLKAGGVYIHTFPIYKQQVEAAVRYAELSTDGTVRHLVAKPEYHGNPIDKNGSLVTFHYGYDIHRQIAGWGPFEVSIIRSWDETRGIIGEFTDVVVCRKPPSLSHTDASAASEDA